jgi:thiosulfate dehydrogenase [quinone] large subunit
MDQSPDKLKPLEVASPEAVHDQPPGIALTLAEAADACGVGRGTIYRWLDGGAFPNAYREQEGGSWRITVVDLEAAGLRPRRHLYRRVAVARIAFGVLFGIDASLKWLPSFSRGGFLDQISGAAQSQPSWLHPWFHFWTQVASSNPRLFAYATAVVETLIALALVFGVARAVTYFAAALFTLAIWAIPEGFGGPYTHGATDIGTGIIYAVVFLALYQLDTLADESPWSLDPLIERRFPRWRMLSEPWFRVRGGGQGTVASVDGTSS